ncbi:glycosyltransferase family 4 protein [Kordiimonas marina]|uniref:glycosyltransferase family 4 protein n=1 Tax=Kordiimonas marina TaxID=2872312 RepID=UPI001FF32B62|nr:glycosyltransferase family 4 protein [Kordiimonas marina]MCJ9429979.1 glycosyltransferase family 4 protein [Kordiimonas marina]
MSVTGTGKISRLLIVSKFFRVGFGGVPESLLQLARHLGAAAVSTDVLTRNGYHRHVGDLEFLPMTEDPLSATVDLHTYDVALIAGAWNFRSLGVAWRTVQRGIPILYAPKGQLCKADFVRLRDMKKLAYLLSVEIWLLVLADRIIFSSTAEQRACIVPAFFTRRKAIILPEPYEGRATLPDLGNRDRPTGLHIGFISQASPRKGLSELVTGFLEWCRENPEKEAYLHVAGTAIKGSEAYWDRIVAQAKGHPCGDRVEFLGQVSGPTRDAFYDMIDILAVPSRFESFCLTLTEALWAGKPVFAGPDIGVLEFLPPHGGIYVLPEVTSGAVRGALAYFSENREKMAAAGREIARKPIPHLRGRDIAERYIEEIGKIKKGYS